MTATEATGMPLVITVRPNGDIACDSEHIMFDSDLERLLERAIAGLRQRRVPQAWNSRHWTQTDMPAPTAGPAQLEQLERTLRQLTTSIDRLSNRV